MGNVTSFAAGRNQKSWRRKESVRKQWQWPAAAAAAAVLILVFGCQSILNLSDLVDTGPICECDITVLFLRLGRGQKGQKMPKSRIADITLTNSHHDDSQFYPR